MERITISDNTISFCSNCEGLVLPKKYTDHIDFICRRCKHLERTINLKVKEKLIEDIPSKTTIEETKIDEDYDFQNKKASRYMIKQYLQKVQDIGFLKAFSEMKVLILTHIEGYDIKEVLLPLGFSKKNIYIVERDPIVYTKICDNPFFAECYKINKELIDFNGHIQFDLLYLDFKSNICYETIEILTKLINHNAHLGTIIYTNFQMAREVKTITNLYYELEKKLITSYNTDIENKMNLLLECFNNEKCKVDQFVDSFDFEIENKKENIEVLKDRKNFHILRQKALQNIFQNILQCSFYNRKRLNSEFISKVKKIQLLKANLTQNNSIKQDILTIRVGLKYSTEDLIDIQNDMSNSDIITHYLGGYPIVSFFKQFIYRNRNDTPFLSTIFQLSNEKDMLCKLGFRDLSSVLNSSLFLINLYNKGIVKNESLDLMLYEFFCMQNINIKKGYDIFKESQNETRLVMNNIKKIYHELYENKNLFENLYKDSLSSIFINPLNNLFITHTEHFDEFIDSYNKQIKDRAKRENQVSDYSHYMILFYFILNILKNLNQIMFKKNELTQSDFIDIPESITIDEYFNLNKIKFEFNRDLIDEINFFRTDTHQTIDFFIEKVINSARKSNYQNELQGRINNLKKILSDMFFNEKETSKSIMKIDKVKIMSEEQIEKISKEFIGKYPNEKSSITLERIKTYCKELGIKENLSECQIRGWKAWINYPNMRDQIKN